MKNLLWEVEAPESKDVSRVRGGSRRGKRLQVASENGPVEIVHLPMVILHSKYHGENQLFRLGHLPMINSWYTNGLPKGTSFWKRTLSDIATLIIFGLTGVRPQNEPLRIDVAP